MAETAVFLDRDGTVIEDVGYLRDANDLVIYEEAIEAVRLLRDHGMKVIIVTNQSAVARGMLSEKTLAEIHDVLRDAFQHQGVPLDGIYYCPHLPQAKVLRYRRHCSCRKPEPGLLRRAAESMEIDLGRSFMAGDKQIDVIAGHRAGCRSVLVRTGMGEQTLQQLSKAGWKPELGSRSVEEPDALAMDLVEAAEWMLANRESVP